MKVLIIGAGVAGLGIGWRLAQAGADVTIVERAQPGRGATWASAGMIAVGGEGHGHNTPEAQFALHSSTLWPAFAAELEAVSGVDIAYLQSGALILSSESSLAPLAGVERIDRAQMVALEPMLTGEWPTVLWAKDDAQVDNRRLGDALTVAFRRAGGTLLRNEPAIRIAIAGGRAAGVQTPFGYREAEVIVLAAGAWSSSIDGLPLDAAPPVVPVKGQMVSLEPRGPSAVPGRAIWGNDVYLLPRHGRLFIGATVEHCGFDTGTTQAAADWLLSRATQLIPSLAAWRIAEHWAGLRPGTPDGLPILGPTRVEGLYAATGQFRNGILFAPAIADLISAMLLRSEPVLAAFDPRRFIPSTSVPSDKV